jgi:hypothetical protein
MILADVLLRFLPELVVVVTPDEMATHARDLLHALIVRPKAVRTLTHFGIGFFRAPPLEALMHKPDDPSRLIDARIAELGDWRGELLARIRALIHQADPEVVEEWKWRGVPTWSHAGIICTGETYKNVVKTTFAKGASLEDPSGLFNSSLEGNTRRAIDFHEGDEIDEKALKALIRAAVDLNTSA